MTKAAKATTDRFLFNSGLRPEGKHGSKARGGKRPLALLVLGASRLHDVGSTDPLAFGAMSLVLILTAVIACWLPARRTVSIDPISSLREG